MLLIQLMYDSVKNCRCLCDHSKERVKLNSKGSLFFPKINMVPAYSLLIIELKTDLNVLAMSIYPSLRCSSRKMLLLHM